MVSSDINVVCVHKTCAKKIHFPLIDLCNMLEFFDESDFSKMNGIRDSAIRQNNKCSLVNMLHSVFKVHFIHKLPLKRTQSIPMIMFLA